MSPRVIRMNEATSDDIDQIPMPARQQLGILDPRVDVDARSGNGLRDKVEMQDVQGANYQAPNPMDGGGSVQRVTYHLESTPPPVEPAGAPGSESYNRNVRGVPGAEDSDTHRVSTDGGSSIAAYQHEGTPATTQHEQPGRNERIAAQAGLSDSGSVHADSGSAAGVQTSPSISDSGSTSDDASGDQSGGSLKDEVPDGAVATVLSWVGDDQARARAAIERENEKTQPRSSLLSQLNEKL